MVWCKGILSILLSFYGLIMMYFPCMLVICVPYIASDLLMSYISIGRFLNWFFSNGLFYFLCWCTSYYLLDYSCAFRSFGLKSLEVFLVDIYCVQDILISNLSVSNVMFHVSFVKIIESSAAFIEYDHGAVVKVHIYGWF